MMGAGARDAAINPSCSVTKILSLAGMDFVKYISWSGRFGNLTALFERAIAHVPSRLFMRAASSNTSFSKAMQPKYVGAFCQGGVSNTCGFYGLRAHWSLRANPILRMKKHCCSWHSVRFEEAC